MRYARALFLGAVVSFGTGCGYQALEPGHRGLRFDPHAGGLKHEVLQPGYHGLGWCFLRDCGRLDDFDVTFSTKKEDIHTPSQEGLAMDLKLAVIYRPVISELYELDTEIGPNYYDEVIGPEFRSAARGVFARHSYAELVSKNEKIEDEIEAEVRRRTQGKHVEIASITMESIDYAPEIANAVRAKLVGEQEAIRQKAALENEALRQKLLLEQQAAQQRMKAETDADARRVKAEHDAEQEKTRVELSLMTKKNERAIATEQAAIDKLQAAAEAETRVVRAKGQAQELTILAKAHADENRAQTLAVSPLTVQLAAYEALGKLGGNGTTVLLGDWSRAPQFLFPRTGIFTNAYGPAPAGPAPAAQGPSSLSAPTASR